MNRGCLCCVSKYTVRDLPLFHTGNTLISFKSFFIFFVVKLMCHVLKCESSSMTTGQYTIPLECLQPGYRYVPLQTLTGEDLPYSRLFVHVALTNRRGGGKPHKRGLSVRKARKGRNYTALRDLGVRAVDEVFKMAAAPLREATDLRENMQVRYNVHLQHPVLPTNYNYFFSSF